jgi:RNA-directed DNA polymerase
MEETSTTVSARTKQVEDASTQWEWAEPAIWTEKMLETLQRGVKGGKWYSLIDKV